MHRPFPKILRLVAALSGALPCFWQGPLHAQQPSPVSTRTASAAESAPVSLDPWLTSPTLWQTAPDRFPQARAYGFRWVSNARDAARAANPALRLHDLPVAEVIIRFAPADASVPAASPGIAPAPAAVAATGGKTLLSGVQISIFNRGDAGDLDQRRFEALVEQSKNALDALANVRPVDRGTDNASAVQSRGLVWVTPTSRWLLEWSATPENRVQGVAYRAEFIRLKITPQHDGPRSVLDQMRAESNPAAAGTPKPVAVRASELPARLARDADGGEWLPNIPMVDQGQKGYCVTAATERVLRYYGLDVDQNELAQIANTSTTGGTSTTEMVAALRKLASRFKVSIFTEIELNYPDFLREIDDYNRAARSAPKSLGVLPIDTRAQPLSYEVVTDQMNGEVLRDARTKLNPAYMTRFEQAVQTHVARGIPLLWSVTLGLLPEQDVPPQTRGGHMRLIIGYNAKTKEIYYSDSWGRGHELRKMPLANAWTITNGLFTLEPS